MYVCKFLSLTFTSYCFSSFSTLNQFYFTTKLASFTTHQNSLSINTKKINLSLVSIPCSRSLPEIISVLHISTWMYRLYLKVNSDRSIPTVRCYCLSVTFLPFPSPSISRFFLALVLTSVQQLTITRRCSLIRTRPSDARLRVYSYFEKRFRKKCTRQSRKV